LVLGVSTVLVAFHKPYGFLSQFTPEPGSKWRTLADFGFPPRLYPIGRLDADSEGLLLLSDEAALNARLLHPTRGHTRTYWALVERIPSPEALAALEAGVLLGGRRTLPCRARLLEPQPDVAPRNPPVRFRKTVADCWIALDLVEGKYHQVRKMTASVGHPTLRLVRVAIGAFPLGSLAPGAWRALDAADRQAVLGA
jgi:23S rRNA pseudouridine2457 synthase